MILFNALQKSISAGIGRYSYELSKELYFLLNKDIKIIIRHEDLEDYKFVKSDSLLVFKNIKNSKDRNLFEQIHIPKLVNQNFKDSIVHYPDSMIPIFSNNKKMVITVHDLAFKTMSNTFTKKTVLWKNFMTNIGVKKANRIISITNFSKSELCKYYDSIDSKIDVVYNGFNRLGDTEIKHDNISNKVKDMCLNKYILTVSTISPRKNMDTLIKAFNLIKNKCDVNLMIAGSNGWLYESIYELVRSLNLENRVIFTGRINDDELKYLYKNSSVFVYPSLYEGFGLPPLEAMSYGIKVIVSDVECLREVLGDGCIYFKPKDHEQLANILEEFYKQEQGSKLYNYDNTLNKYSWKKCAEETVKVYDKILKGV